jgi:hypothetical protein
MEEDKEELLSEAVRWCPMHHMPDCSPLLNGCTLPDRQAKALEFILDSREAAITVVDAAREMTLERETPDERLMVLNLKKVRASIRHYDDPEDKS